MINLETMKNKNCPGCPIKGRPGKYAAEMSVTGSYSTFAKFNNNGSTGC